MQITSFRITNYRAILDSNWIDINDITVIVGKNESGKTSLLKALWKFNPSNKEKFNLEKEWPRNPRHKVKKSTDAKVVTVRFEFNESEKLKVGELDDFFKNVIGIEISRNYADETEYSLLPEKLFDQRETARINEIAEKYATLKLVNSSISFNSRFDTSFSIVLKKIRKSKHTLQAAAIVKDFKEKLPSNVSSKETEKESDIAALTIANSSIDQMITELEEDPVYDTFISTVEEWLPKFIYMDDYRIFSGTAQLNEVKTRRDSGLLTPEDQTFLTILDLSDLDLDQEVARGSELDKQQRIIDRRNASLRLTEKIAKRWTQKDYEVEFEIDGQHFVTFVTDKLNVRVDEKTQIKESSKTPVALEERSKGFQWFFSFDMNFIHETNGEYENAILLLDEPGLHLHAAAQNDLLNRFNEYATSNQIIYTTHLPFMIDTKRFDNIVIAEEDNENGLKFHKDWATADEDARFTLQAALGMSWSQFLFINPFNLVVEGFTDFIYLSTISTLLNAENGSGIDPDLTITMAGGGSRAAYMASILAGQKLKVAVLLDSDQEGIVAHDQLVKSWIMKSDQVHLIGNIFGVKHTYSIEDLFPKEYYMTFVNKIYSDDLKKKPLLIGVSDRSIVELITEALEARGITKKLNKGSIAKAITSDLLQKPMSEVPEELIRNFCKLFEILNKTMSKWKE